MLINELAQGNSSQKVKSPNGGIHNQQGTVY